MSAVLIDTSRLAPKSQPVNDEVKIGKDILELVTGAMYTNPLSVFREYVQNGADSIDVFRSSHPQHVGKIQISLDTVARSVLVRDNGAAIKDHDFVSKLIAFGASEKRGTGLRGFRGVGRLSGLGFCQELIFRGRALGDKRVTEVTWDGRILKQLLKDPSFEGSLQDIVKQAVTVKHLSGQDHPDHFFEVELRKVLRLKSDVLLNDEVIRNYLAQVAPAPLASSFAFHSEVEQLLAVNNVSPPVDIRVGDVDTLHRFQSTKTQAAVLPKISNIEVFDLTGIDGEVTAFGWIAQQTYAGSISRELGWGGLRFRVGNIQVGDAELAARLFPEDRFNGWTIGEIHVTSARILPNARRDDFEPNIHYAHFQDAVSVKTKEITHQIRHHSVVRNRVKAVDAELKRVDEWLKVGKSTNASRLVLGVVQEFSRMSLDKSFDTIAKNQDMDGAAELKKKASKLRLEIDDLNGKGSRKSAARTKELGLNDALTAAVRAIISSARSPKEGVTIASSVVHAFENQLSH